MPDRSKPADGDRGLTDTRHLSKREQRGFRRAARARLRYVNNFDKGYSRRRCGRGFTYLSTRGKTIRSSRTRKRIEALAIPPSWRDVWICPRADGHIQAVGRDEAGRRQYIYHERWRAVSRAVKFDRLGLMAEVLPRVRRRVRRDLSRKRLTRDRAVAAAVRLIDKAHMRVGSEIYTDAHGSRGVTTLRDEHVAIDGMTISLDYPAKSGRRREIDINDAKVARVIDRCEEIDGQFLFCYRDDDGCFVPIDSTDVNDYLASVARRPITAKDFRTWAGTTAAFADLTGEPLPESSGARRKRVIRAVTETARMLGNTKAVARASYIHPALLAAATSGELDDLLGAAGDAPDIRELTRDECRLAALLPLL